MKAILGIDPGIEGGLALRWSREVLVEPMPKAFDGDGLDLPKLHLWLKSWADEIAIALLEQQGVRPKQDPMSGFKTGRGFGQIEALLVAAGIRYQVIRPQIWSEAFDHGVTETDRAIRYRLIKKARKRIVGELFPTLDLRESERSRTPHGGMTDALLIAEWGSRTLRGVA